MRKAVPIVFAVLWFVGANADEQVLSLVSSSDFEMRLSPTFQELDISATTIVEDEMKIALLLSASVTSNFGSAVFDIDIVLQQVKLRDDEDEFDGKGERYFSTWLQFEVHMTFFKDKLLSSAPSQFGLDSLIVRTFSQPSTKSSFIDKLATSKEPLLTGIDDVEIHLADTISDDPAVTPSSSLSTLDIVLIVASASIFLGICYVIYQHHKDTAELEERQIQSLREWHKRAKESKSRAKVNELDEKCGDPTRPKSFEDGGSSGEDTSRDDTSKAEAAENSLPGGVRAPEICALGRVKLTEECNSKASVSPPISPCSSMESSSIDSPQSSVDSKRFSPVPSSPVPSSPVSSAHSTPYRLGAPPPSYPVDSFSSSSPSSESSPLAARLLRLPMLNDEECPSPSPNPFKSSASAPGTIMDLMSASTATEQSEVDGASRRSSRSVSVTSRSYRQCVETSSSRSSSNITDFAVTSTRTLLTDNHNFERNWAESKQKALEDDEDHNVEDVFQIDVEAHNSVEDNQSRMSGLSAVSEWLKSIRVVGSSSDTRTSDMTNSSAEHSSVEPKSFQTKEMSSVECSLERSMADSLVEV